jgi:hypothetical protein
MSAQKRRVICAAILFAGLCSAQALMTVAPVLTNATWSGNQFQFTLLGETNVSYILQSSADLRTWTPALTNSDLHATRTVIVPAAGPQTFWRVRPVPGPAFEHAILARGSITLGGTGLIDSFDSADANYSDPNGHYDPSKAKAGGHIATGMRTPSAVNVGSMRVAGTVSTGPGGTVMLSPNGGVGSFAWLANPVNAGLVEPDYLQTIAGAFLPYANLPYDFVPNFLPQNVLIPPAPGGTNYTYAVTTDGDYRAGNFSLGIGQKMLIAARCRIHIIGSTTVSSSAYILMGTNASVEFYCMGRVDIQGQGVINAGGYAKDFSINVLTSQPVNYGGQARFVGTIYAPLSSVTLVGTADAIGAIVCNSFNLNGSMGIHFDENLKRVGPFR